MKVTNLKIVGSWREVADAARTTIGLEPGTKEPSAKWKRTILRCEHSPIRKMFVSWKWEDLPYWVSVHFTRHKFGIEHWVSTQRTDRTGVDRATLPQNALVDHECLCNLAEFIFISRRRLCHQASTETRLAWRAVVNAVGAIDGSIASACVPECVYRGFCPEFKTCGFANSDAFIKCLSDYRNFAIDNR